LIDCIDVPVVGVCAAERTNALELRTWVKIHQPQHAYAERAQAYPKQGSSSGFKYGRAVGAIEAVITVCNIPVEIVEPSMWKRALRLRGKDKEAARQYALQLFPHAHHLLKRKLDHGRAEAALIAYVGSNHLMLAKPEPVPLSLSEVTA
jgi:hypothetical protein